MELCRGQIVKSVVPSSLLTSLGPIFSSGLFIYKQDSKCGDLLEILCNCVSSLCKTLSIPSLANQKEIDNSKRK